MEKVRARVRTSPEAVIQMALASAYCTSRRKRESICEVSACAAFGTRSRQLKLFCRTASG